MKFTTVLFSAALIASAAAETATVTTTSTAPVKTDSSYGPQVDACLKSCADKDVNCKATCLGNPNPTKEQVDQTNKCYAACPQGNGTKEETEAYAKCQHDCTLKYFLPNPSNVPTMGATQTGSSTPTATDSNGNPGNSTKTSTTTSSTAKPSNNSGASAMVYSASFSGAVAILAAFFAL